MNEDKVSVKKSKFNRYFQLVLLVLSAGCIYPIVYLRAYYQQTMLTVYHITITQLDMIYSVLGLVFIIGYIPSGLIADKFSAKKLMLVSLFLTALGGFWLAQIPNYTSILLIYAIWGFSTVFTFWAALLKMIKLLSKSDEQGRFFGILDGGRGIVEAVLASAAVAIFASVLGKSTNEALTRVVYMYAIALVVVCILVFFFVSSDKNKQLQTDESEKFQIGAIRYILKNKSVLLLGAIIFTSYVVTWTRYYYGSFLQAKLGVSAVLVSAIMLISAWMRPVGGIIGGFLADRFDRKRILSLVVLLSALMLAVLVLLPLHTSKLVFYTVVTAASLFTWAIRGIYWSLLEDCKIENQTTGTAIGVISFLGYWPDIVVPIFINLLVSVFGATGYFSPYFGISAGVGVISLLLIHFFVKLTKKENMEMEAQL